MEIKIAIEHFIFWFLELRIAIPFLFPHGVDDNINVCISSGLQACIRYPYLRKTKSNPGAFFPQFLWKVYSLLIDIIIQLTDLYEYQEADCCDWRERITFGGYISVS